MNVNQGVCLLSVKIVRIKFCIKCNPILSTPVKNRYSLS